MHLDKRFLDLSCLEINCDKKEIAISDTTSLQWKKKKKKLSW